MSYILQCTGQNQTILADPIESKMFRAEVLDEKFHAQKNSVKRANLVTVNAWFTKDESGEWLFNFEDGVGGEARSLPLAIAQESQDSQNIISARD